MIRRLAGLTGALALVLSLPIFPPASAAGAAITQVGWWSQRPGASEQPQGGFELALAPNGPISQAALRITVDAVQLNSALLELTESQAAGAEVASVVACPTTDAWQAANPGAWSDAPEPDCTRREALSRRQNGEWVGDIGELLGFGVVSVVLVPMSHADTQGAPIPYQLVFSGAKLSASAPATPAPPPTTSGTSGGTPTAPEPPRVIAAPDSPQGGAAGGPPPVAVERDDNEEDETSFAVGDIDDDGGTPRPWWRLAILAPLAALVGAGAVFARRTARERGWSA
jgi:hypothetical protein